MNTYIKRHPEDCIFEAAKNYSVVMVCGQRQVGLFFETYGTKLFIDEYQRVPSILIEIKKAKILLTPLKTSTLSVYMKKRSCRV